MAKVNAGKFTFYLGMAALLTILTAVSSAQLLPQQDVDIDEEQSMGRERPDGWMHGAGMPFMGVPVEMIVGGSGFALQGNATHLLRINVERLSALDPGQIRNLLVSNKSIVEIREAIKAEEGQPLYRGSMRLDDTGYPMINIDVRALNDTATVVDADISLPGLNRENQTDIIGHLDMTVFISKGGRIGEGQLEINSAEHRGSYHMLLDMSDHAKHFERMVTHMESEHMGSEDNRGLERQKIEGDLDWDSGLAPA